MSYTRIDFLQKKVKRLFENAQPNDQTAKLINNANKIINQETKKLSQTNRNNIKKTFAREIGLLSQEHKNKLQQIRQTAMGFAEQLSPHLSEQNKKTFLADVKQHAEIIETISRAPEVQSLFKNITQQLSSVVPSFNQLSLFLKLSMIVNTFAELTQVYKVHGGGGYCESKSYCVAGKITTRAINSTITEVVTRFSRDIDKVYTSGNKENAGNYYQLTNCLTSHAVGNAIVSALADYLYPFNETRGPNDPYSYTTDTWNVWRTTFTVQKTPTDAGPLLDAALSALYNRCTDDQGAINYNLLIAGCVIGGALVLGVGGRLLQEWCCSSSSSRGNYSAPRASV